jgi:hypothetical protein
MTLEEKKISAKSRVRYGERLEVISPDFELLPNGDGTMNRGEDADEESA